MYAYRKYCSHIWVEKKLSSKNAKGNEKGKVSVHRYLRAIGFSNIKKREQLQQLIGEVVTKTIVHPVEHESEEAAEEHYSAVKDFAMDSDEKIYAELFLDFAKDTGICVRGEVDKDNVFLYEYYFPYVRSTHVSSYEDVSVERHAEKESYAGVCDDIKVGVSLIFYLQNMIPYKRLNYQKLLPVKGTSLSLSGLSISGTIMMPINKNEQEKQKIKKVSSERNQLLAQARMGDEDAIESLTLEDMDTYTAISRKIHKEDVFSLVDTYFMPYGVECDLYSVLGEITDFTKTKNRITGEELILISLDCNELLIDICINKTDLYGEAAIGRRFKGVIWLQGYINFPIAQTNKSS